MLALLCAKAAKETGIRPIALRNKHYVRKQ